MRNHVLLGARGGRGLGLVAAPLAEDVLVRLAAEVGEVLGHFVSVLYICTAEACAPRSYARPRPVLRVARLPGAEGPC